jgi:hypothetical protein
MKRLSQLNVYTAKEPITRVRTVSLNLAHILEEQIIKMRTVFIRIEEERLRRSMHC